MKKFILQRKLTWEDDWEDDSETYTFEEAKSIHENHYDKYEYQFRILEIHFLG